MTLVSGRRTRNPNLTSYLEYMFDLPKKAKVPLHEALCRQWLNVIKEQVRYILSRFSSMRALGGACDLTNGLPLLPSLQS
jgi:hypothetical protein